MDRLLKFRDIRRDQAWVQPSGESVRQDDLRQGLATDSGRTLSSGGLDQAAEVEESLPQAVAPGLELRVGPEQVDQGLPWVGALRMGCQVRQERACLLRGETSHDPVFLQGAQAAQHLNPP